VFSAAKVAELVLSYLVADETETYGKALSDHPDQELDKGGLRLMKRLVVTYRKIDEAIADQVFPLTRSGSTGLAEGRS